MKYLIALCLLLTACVTSADLYEISDAVHQLETGKADAATTADRIDGVIADVEERTAALTDPSNLPKTPGDWAAWILSLGVMGTASGVGVNRYRNKKRVKNNEVV